MMTAADVARALAERLEALVRELLPDGRREGHEWLVGNVHGERGSSLGVHLSGPKTGVWCDCHRRKRRCARSGQSRAWR